MTWDRGSQVAVRSRPDGNVGYTFPVIVVRDTPELIALFQPSGTVCKRRGGPRGGPGGRYLMTWDGSYEDVVFDLATIHAHVPGDHFWVIRVWNGSEYVGWYVNLATPWRRTPIGFDTLDQTLDIRVTDDLSDWSWKDEDELAWAVDDGRYSPAEAETIRRHGADAIDRMNERAFPFHSDWSEMHPDPGWSIPVLPVGWHRAGAHRPR